MPTDNVKDTSVGSGGYLNELSSIIQKNVSKFFHVGSKIRTITEQFCWQRKGKFENLGKGGERKIFPHLKKKFH